MKIQPILLARISIVIVLVALARTLSEILRLAYVNGVPPNWEIIKAYTIGSMLWVFACLLMIIAYFMHKYQSVWIIGILTVGCLIGYKLTYLP